MKAHRAGAYLLSLMQRAKQRGFRDHFYSLWFDLGGDRTLTSQSQGRH